MKAPHNKKKRYCSRSRRRRKNYNYRNNTVFGDSAVPSLHDVTLKMHKVIDHADNAMLSFKPINYNRIHKRWRNKKYKLVSGGQVETEDQTNAQVKQLTGDSELSVELVDEAANKDVAASSSSVESKGDYECLDSKAQRTFSGRLKNNDTIVITENTEGTYDAFIQHLAALGDDAATANAKDVVVQVSAKAPPAVPLAVPPPVVKDNVLAGNQVLPVTAPAASVKTSGANSVDAAAAVAGVAGAAAAAALFTDDHSPAIIRPTLSEFKITPDTVTMGAKPPTVTKPDSESNGAIEYSSNNSDVATINSETGEITLVNAGTVTFTAKQAANNNYAAAKKESNELTVNPAAPSEKEPQLDWTGLKARWVQVHSTPMAAYEKELTEDAGDPGKPLKVIRQAIFDWLKINDPLDTAFNFIDAQNKANSENNELYTALNDWIAKWNEYGGKIRTITSIKGGESPKGPPVEIINTGTGTGTVHNVTKVTFAPGYDLAENEKKAYGLDDNQYGNFYAGFDATDTNAQRYEKGNFKDMIGTLAKGGNAAIFGYGYSGSGKTYTLTNYEPGNSDANGIAINLLGELIKSQKFNIELTISELYCSDFTITSQHAVLFKETDKKLEEYDISESSNKKIKIIGSINDFIAAINKVKTDRIANHHIKYTLNNPESSRGHLFYKFTITSVSAVPATTATLTIVDMGGRENPVELSDSSYMIIKGSPLGQIVDRTSNNEAVYYGRSAGGVYQPMPDKHVSIDAVCSNVRHITGEHHTAEDWQNKCHSIIASSFGGLFFDNNKYHAFDDGYSYDKLPLRDPEMVKDKKDKAIISDKIKLFLDACKEGLYINETINHLVAYINFLSNISKIKNIPKNIAIANVQGKGTLITLEKNRDAVGSATDYRYHPERYIINPLGFIKNKAAGKLQTLINDNAIYYDKKNDKNSTDTVGILTQLWDIKNPDEEVPAIICFIACVRNDNSLTKHEIATKATLDFAMSVSASNAPPPTTDDVRPGTSQKEVFEGPAKPLQPKSIAEKILPYVGNSSQLKKLVNPIVNKFKIDKTTKAKQGDGNAFLTFLRKEIITKISEKDSAIVNELEEPILLQVLQYLISRQNELNFLPQFKYEGRSVSLDNVAQYKGANNKLIKAAKDLGKAGGAGSGAKTRRRESRREKKNRRTRRRNRV